MERAADSNKTERLDEFVKVIFDNLRNYIICGSVWFAGNYVLQHPEINKIAIVSRAAGAILLLLSLVLFSVNTVHGILKIKSMRPPIRVWSYLITAPICIIVLLNLVTAMGSK